jgi:hypothetical protein
MSSFGLRRKRTTHAKGGQQTKNTKQLVRKEVKAILHQNIMIKYLDSGLLNQNVTAGGAVNALVNIPQGDTQSQRVSDVIFMSKMELTFSLEMANADIYATSRLIVFQWFPNTLPVVASVLESPGSLFCYSNYNFQTQDLYSIHFDSMYHQSGTATAPTESTNVGKKQMRVRIGRKKVEYALASTTVMTNQLWLLYISDSAVIPYPVINWVSRIFYAETKA